jgi:acetyl-CoA acetyltransferase
MLRQAAIVGVGRQLSSVDLDSTGLETLAATSCRRAIEDSGIGRTDIDAIFEYRFGADSPDAVTMQRLLGLGDLAIYGDLENTGPGGLMGVAYAVMAVTSGACDVALAYRCISRSAATHAAPTTSSGARPPAGRGGSRDEFTMGFGDGRPDNILIPMALRKQRRLAELGGVEDYATVALNARRWGAMNPDAALRSPLTLDDYLHSPAIVDPLVRLDCDYPINGSTAVVITSGERARDLRHRPVVVDAFAFGTGAAPDWVFADDFLYGGTIQCASRLWSRSSLRPADIDIAEVYDGFTHIAISWVEALGFCDRGEFGDWCESGERIGPGGVLPLNTSGGQLSEGRLHGLGLLAEAVGQLRGTVGERQVRAAASAVVTNGFGPQCLAMTLTTD